MLIGFLFYIIIPPPSLLVQTFRVQTSDYCNRFNVLGNKLAHNAFVILLKILAHIKSRYVYDLKIPINCPQKAYAVMHETHFVWSLIFHSLVLRLFMFCLI